MSEAWMNKRRRRIFWRFYMNYFNPTVSQTS